MTFLGKIVLTFRHTSTNKNKNIKVTEAKTDKLCINNKKKNLFYTQWKKTKILTEQKDRKFIIIFNNLASFLNLEFAF
jgi:hypothetical protein